MFKDPYEPTKDEIKAWAYTDDSSPVEDFELLVDDDPYFSLELASDEKCPKKNFFLGSLYVWAGDCVKNKLNLDVLTKWLEVASKSKDNRIKKLVERARRLLSGEEKYDYNKWGIGEEYTKEAYSEEK